MNATQYITTENDRWDLIASKAYGTTDVVDGFNPIRELQSANPYLSIVFKFKAGVKIIVPIRTELNTVNPNLLPPWKRGQKISDAPAIAGSFNTDIPSSFDSSFG